MIVQPVSGLYCTAGVTVCCTGSHAGWIVAGVWDGDNKLLICCKRTTFFNSIFLLFCLWSWICPGPQCAGRKRDVALPKKVDIVGKLDKLINSNEWTSMSSEATYTTLHAHGTDSPSCDASFNNANQHVHRTIHTPSWSIRIGIDFVVHM